MKADWRQASLWPLLAAVLCGVLWYLLLARIGTEEAQTRSEALKEAALAGQEYAQYLLGAVAQVDALASQIEQGWKVKGDRLSLDEFSQSALVRGSAIASITIIGPQGTTLAHAGERPGMPVHGSQTYFDFHAHDESDVLLIGVPQLQAGAESSVVAFSRRLSSASGEFEGLVLILVHSAYLTAFRAGAMPTKDGFLAVAGTDGSLRALKVAASESVAKGPMLHSVPLFDKGSGSALLAGREWFDDERPRVVGWETLRDYPVLAMVGIPEDFYLDGRRATWRAYRQGGSTATLLLAGLALIASTMSIRAARSRERAERALQLGRTALRESEERFRNAFDYAAHGMALISLDGRCFKVNPPLCRMLGYGEPEISQFDLLDITHEEDREADSQLRRDLESGSIASYQREKRYLHKNGQTVWARVSVGLVRQESGEPAYFVAQLEDISAYKHAQSELVRAEKLASLGALVAGMAHELNTPIGNAVMVATTLSGRQREFEASMAGGLRRSALESFLADAREVSEVLERNLQRAASLIGSFKQIAVDQSSYQRRPFELQEVVQEIAIALSPTLRASGVQLLDETPVGLRMDSFPGPLGQVFINLVNNAVVHAFEGGPPGSVRIAAERVAPNRVRILVSDDGRGIEPEHLKQIFDPFFTTKLGQGGSGLGLHIVYTLVTGLLGGRIEVRSAPGQGTEFQIELPQAAPAQAGDNPAIG